MPARKSLTLTDKALDEVNRLRFTIRRDGVAWPDIDSAVLIFERPDRVTGFERAMVAENASTGIWYYDTVSGDWDEIGYWTLSVRVTDGATVISYPYEIGVRVRDNP